MKGYLLKADEDWDWKDLRDFVEDSYANLATNYTKAPEREASIYKAFMKRWPNSVAMTRYAIRLNGGLWHGIPIVPLNFRKDADPKFAEEIARLMER